MELLINVQDQKAAWLVELLEELSFVKIESPFSGKEQVLKELDEAVENMKLVQAGKLQATPIEELLDAV